ncbi:AgrD family cyclic lactone autoinducer peptide [Shouchella sp. JSM 1781072]|nr:cyclic lactone autoinducer peptide [Alkalihalobacillus sp. LMS6]UTR07058.1 cyclic lactone autoinducer peptide [Alkalihalobacillus sp. LMS6]
MTNFVLKMLAVFGLASSKGTLASVYFSHEPELPESLKAKE